MQDFPKTGQQNFTREDALASSRLCIRIEKQCFPRLDGLYAAPCRKLAAPLQSDAASLNERQALRQTNGISPSDQQE
ncbi:hypothetical protein BBL07_04025 [Agrobacterium vitis]|nr:hypothetical protein BBL07_04025 [Agrobacterium vitis]